MAKIFITGSADGLGYLAAKMLIELGHQVVLHARNAERRLEVIRKAQGAVSVLTGDLSNIEETKKLAHEVNRIGTLDAVIHNAGVYQASAKEIFAVNTLAPYILTCLIQRPKRLIYLSSGMHLQGHSKLDYFNTNISRITYSDSKLHVLILCMAVARKWKDVYANALEPGWVATKMGGPSAPDSLEDAPKTQAWLAVSNDPGALVTGKYFYHMQQSPFNPIAKDVQAQDKFLLECQRFSGITFPQ